MTEVYDGIRFSPEQIQLLRNRIVKNESAKVTLQMAVKHYSSKNAAENSLSSLESKGVLERKNNGVWAISNLPDELYQEWLGE